MVVSRRAQRVLFLDQWGYIGGAQVVLLELLALALEDGHEVHLGIPLGGPLEERVRTLFGDRVRLHAMEAPRATSGRKSLADLWRLARSVRSTRFPTIAAQVDLVHVNGPRLYGAWRQANRGWQRPTIYHVHLNHSALERVYIRRVIAGDPLGVIVASSVEVARGLAARGGARPVALVQNGVPRAAAEAPFVDRWSIDVPGAAASSDPVSRREAGALRWAVIGVLSPLKGQDLAVEAARLMPESELLLIGDVAAEHAVWAAELRQQAPPNVRFVGAVASVPETLSREAVQVVAVTSRRAESFSLAAVEGMASSCVAILLTSAGTEEVCAVTESPRVEGVAGLVAELRRLEADPAAALAMATMQYSRAHERYGPSRFAHEMRAVMRERLAAQRFTEG
jgi:glycosyltransferase involved in cell wall biosynthesis